MRFTLCFLLMLSVNLTLEAQDKHDKKIQKFDAEKFNNLKFGFDIDLLDSSAMELDTLTMNSGEDGSIRVYAPQGNMAPMPNMEIRKDVKYTMQIKGLSNKYPYKLKILPDSANIRKSNPPLLEGLKNE